MIGKTLVKRCFALLLALMLAAAFAACGAKTEPVLPPARRGLSTRSDNKLNGYDLPRAYAEAKAVCLITIGNWISENRNTSRYEASVEKAYKGEPGACVTLDFSGSSYCDCGAPLPIYGTRALAFLYRWDEERYGTAYDCPITTFFYLIELDDGAYLVDLIGRAGYDTWVNCPEARLRNQFTYPLRAKLTDAVHGTDAELAEAIRLHDSGFGKNAMKVYSTEDMERLLDSLKEG